MVRGSNIIAKRFGVRNQDMKIVGRKTSNDIFIACVFKPKITIHNVIVYGSLTFIGFHILQNLNRLPVLEV